MPPKPLGDKKRAEEIEFEGRPMEVATLVMLVAALVVLMVV